MACLHIRFVLLFVPFFAPLLAKILARYIPAYDRSKDQILLNAALLAVLVWGFAHYLPTASAVEQKVEANFPVKAVLYLQAHPVAGPMYNTYGYGGYLVWALGSAHRDFIDGRADVYERGGVLGDYMKISLLQPGAFAILKSYGVQSCLLQRDEPLATALAALPDWRTVYRDGHSVLLVRADAASESATSTK